MTRSENAHQEWELLDELSRRIRDAYSDELAEELLEARHRLGTAPGALSKKSRSQWVD